MTAKQRQKEINKQEIIALIESKNFIKDRWGHYKRTTIIATEEKTYRFKISKVVLRYEVKSVYGWVRLASGYWKDLTIKNNKIAGLKY